MLVNIGVRLEFMLMSAPTALEFAPSGTTGPVFLVRGDGYIRHSLNKWICYIIFCTRSWIYSCTCSQMNILHYLHVPRWIRYFLLCIHRWIYLFHFSPMDIYPPLFIDEHISSTFHRWIYFLHFSQMDIFPPLFTDGYVCLLLKIRAGVLYKGCWSENQRGRIGISTELNISCTNI